MNRRRMWAFTLAVATGLAGLGAAFAMRDDGGQPVVASDSNGSAKRAELVRRYSEPGAQRRSVRSVQVKRSTWAEFAAAANLSAEFTAAPGGLPDPTTEVYVVLVRGEMDPAPGYPEVPGRPAYRYMVHVVDATTDRWLYDEAKPEIEQPAYYALLPDRADPPDPARP